jgi:mRNA interferase RelE/StbE
MKYRILYTSRAQKDLRRFQDTTARRKIRTIHTLGEDPYLHVRKLEGSAPDHPVYTFRIGLYHRAILSIHDEVLIVHVLGTENRKQAYRDF